MPKAEKIVQPEFTLDQTKMPDDPNPASSSDEGDGDGGEKKTPITDPAVADLRQQLAELRRMNTETLAALIARPAASVSTNQTTQAPAAVNFDGLPDPSVDREGFLKGATTRMQEAVNGAAARVLEDARRQQAAQAASTDKANSLWADFQEKYEDLGDYGDLVQVAAERTARKLQQRGLNVEAYIDTNRAGFLEEVATDVRKTINTIKGLDNNAATGSDDDEDDGRTAVLPGNSGGTSRGAKKPDNAKPSLFVNELKSIQKELGIF